MSTGISSAVPQIWLAVQFPQHSPSWEQRRRGLGTLGLRSHIHAGV